MISPFHFRSIGRLIGVGLVVAPLVLSAQTMSPPVAPNWRSANDAVGQLKRGHADVLEWEQANLPTEAKASSVVAGLPLQTTEQAIRLAWQGHRELARTLTRLGPDNVARIASGRWLDIDPAFQRRIEGMDEVMDVAVQGRKAWLEAVAANQILAHQRDMFEAAEAASELGQRMVNVGNWSKLQQTQMQLARSTARANVHRAEYAAKLARGKLLKTLRLPEATTNVLLPETLPDIPKQILNTADVQQRALSIQGQLPRAESLGNQANSQMAFAAYATSHALALISRNEVLTVREFITEETVLHYNGMLKSVWDLLDETRNQSQAVIDAIGAQRDFLLAETDLHWVLQGGAPDSFVSLGGSGGDTPAAKGH